MPTRGGSSGLPGRSAETTVQEQAGPTLDQFLAHKIGVHRGRGLSFQALNPFSTPR